MKDFVFVVSAVIGLVLTSVGLTQIQASAARQKSAAETIPAVVEKMLSGNSRSDSSCCPSNQSMVPAETVVYLLLGYVLQMVGCAVYAESRGRSAVFGLLGLLSPVGYIFLALLNRPPPPRYEDLARDSEPSGRGSHLP